MKRTIALLAHQELRIAWRNPPALKLLRRNILRDNASVDIKKAKAVLQSPFTGKDVEKLFRYLENKRYFLITNSDFVKYRSTHKKGGDFVVYSDIGYKDIAPTTFEFKK